MAKTIINTAMILLKDEPEFADVGSGRRNFVHWQGRGKHFLFFVPRLLFIQLTAGQFKKLAVVPKPTNPEPFKLAIESNRSAAQVQGHWDGGVAAQKLIELLSGKDITPEEFTKIVEKPDKPLHGIYVKQAAPERPASPEEAAAEDAAHLAKINAVNEEMGAPHVSNRKTKAPTKAEVAEMKKAKAAKKPAKAKANGKTRKPKAKHEGTISFKVDGNPRREGTSAHGRFKDMRSYIGRHPKATVGDVLTNTSYRGDDLNYDIAHKSIEVKK